MTNLATTESDVAEHARRHAADTDPCPHELLLWSA